MIWEFGHPKMMISYFMISEVAYLTTNGKAYMFHLISGHLQFRYASYWLPMKTIFRSMMSGLRTLGSSIRQFRSGANSKESNFRLAKWSDFEKYIFLPLF